MNPAGGGRIGGLIIGTRTGIIPGGGGGIRIPTHHTIQHSASEIMFSIITSCFHDIVFFINLSIPFLPFHTTLKYIHWHRIHGMTTKTQTGPTYEQCYLGCHPPHLSGQHWGYMPPLYTQWPTPHQGQHFICSIQLLTLNNLNWT